MIHLVVVLILLIPVVAVWALFCHLVGWLFARMVIAFSRHPRGRS